METVISSDIIAVPSHSMKAGLDVTVFRDRHTHTHTHTHTHAHHNNHTHTNTCTNTHTQPEINYMPSYSTTYHIFPHTRMHTHTHTPHTPHTHTRTHTHTHTRTHTTHKHTRTHTGLQIPPDSYFMQSYIDFLSLTPRGGSLALSRLVPCYLLHTVHADEA